MWKGVEGLDKRIQRGRKHNFLDHKAVPRCPSADEWIRKLWYKYSILMHIYGI